MVALPEGVDGWRPVRSLFKMNPQLSAWKSMKAYEEKRKFKEYMLMYTCRLESTLVSPKKQLTNSLHGRQLRVMTLRWTEQAADTDERSRESP